jgi:hypothetical protein
LAQGAFSLSSARLPDEEQADGGSLDSRARRGAGLRILTWRRKASAVVPTATPPPAATLITTSTLVASRTSWKMPLARSAAWAVTALPVKF